VQGIELVRMHDEGPDAQAGELPVEVKTTRSGLVNHEHLVGQGALFLNEEQEGGRGEPLRGLGRLAIAHPDHPEMIDVPVHPNFELLDSVLRFRIQRRIRFHRHVEFTFDVHGLPTS